MNLSHPLAALALALPAVALGAGPAAAACDVTVQITGYQPATLQLDVGRTVTWCWNEGNHSVTGPWGNSGVLDEDATWPHHFTAAGTYSYICSVHNSMQGSVVVAQPSPTPTKTPSRTPSRTPSPTPAKTTAPAPAITSAAATHLPTPSPTPSPTTAAPTTTPPTTAPPTTATPSPSPAPLVIDPAPAKPKTGLAIAIGALVAASSLGGAAWLLIRGRAG